VSVVRPGRLGPLTAVAAALAPIGRVIADFVGEVVVEPVRRGRLRLHRWPRGLVPVGVAALVAYAVAGVAVVVAGPLRGIGRLSSGDLSFPLFAVAPVLVLVVLALALAQTAALHAPWWLAITVTVLTTLVLVSVGVNDTDGSLYSPGRAASVVAVLCVWALLVVRRRRRFAWGEFAIVFGLLAAGVAVPVWQTLQRAAQFGLEAGPITLASTMQSIGLLAVPAAVAAGAAVAQVACSMATQSIASVRRHLPLWVGVVLLTALVAWRIWAVATAIAAREAGTWQGALAAAVLLVGLIGAWAGIRALRPGTEVQPAPAALEARFSSVAQPIAAVLTIGVVPATFCYVAAGIAFSITLTEEPTAGLTALGDFFGATVVVASTRLAIGLALLGLAAFHARRGRAVLPELLASIGVVIAALAAFSLLRAQEWVWSGASVTAVVTISALVLLATLAATRRLTAARGAALGAALLVAALFDQRTFVEDPLRAVFGFTGVAFVLFGFVWTMLTGAETANGTSRRYPRPTRVLFFLANALFGVTVLCFTALARDPGATIELTAVAGLGDATLGSGLLAAALLAALAIAVRPAGGDAATEPLPLNGPPVEPLSEPHRGG
jgi:hypothetical protein